QGHRFHVEVNLRMRAIVDQQRNYLLVLVAVAATVGVGEADDHGIGPWVGSAVDDELHARLQTLRPGQVAERAHGAAADRREGAELSARAAHPTARLRRAADAAAADRAAADDEDHASRIGAALVADLQG